MVGDEIVVGDTPVPKAVATMGDLMRRLKSYGVERITITRGVPEEEIGELVQLLNRTMAGSGSPIDDTDDGGSSLRHVQVGRVKRPGADRGEPDRHGHDPAALHGCRGRRQPRLAHRARRQPPRHDRGSRRRQQPGARRGAEPDRAHGAHGAQELRQLHVHPHGERVDPDDGAGAGARHRRRAAARVRAGRAHARHREGADAARDPQQARQAHRRRVRHHEAPPARRRRDPAADARHAAARAGRRLRAPPAPRRQRLPGRRVAALAQPGHDALQHRGRLRRDADRSAAISRPSRPTGFWRC